VAGVVSPIVRFSPIVRKRGMTIADFSDHWRTTHADAVRGLAGLGRYIQNHPVVEEGKPLLGWMSFDACAEIEFADAETMNAAMSSDHAKRYVVPDSPRFLEADRGGLALTERHVLRDRGAPDEGFKLVTVFRRHPLCSTDELLDALRGPFAEAVEHTNPIRHEQLFPIAELYEDGSAPVCDAVDMLWFEDAADAAAFPSSAAAGEAAAAAAGRVLGVERFVATPVRVN